MNLDPLKWSVQACAASPEIQARLFPDFVVLGDELALTFDDALGVATSVKDRFSPAQQAALAALDAKLDEMSDARDPSLWNAQAVSTRNEWVVVRSLAAAVLAAFDWPAELPPYCLGGVYAQGRD